MNFTESSNISILTSFLQGIFSFFSPCVLPLLPVYFSFLSGGLELSNVSELSNKSNQKFNRYKTVFNSFLFAFGCTFAFLLLALGASAIGKFFLQNKAIFTIIGALLIIFLGLVQFGIFGEKSFFMREIHLPFNIEKIKVSPFTAFLLGFVFSFAWTPCVGPLLASILVMISNANSFKNGILLIIFYSVGFTLPFIISGFFVSSALNFFKTHKNIVRYTTKVAAILMIFIGLFMLYSGIILYMKQDLKVSEKSKTSTSTKNNSEDDSVFAPDFLLYDQNENEWHLKDLRGKTIVLNFWATWCPPCRMEMPDFQKVYDELKNSNNQSVVILGIASPEYGQETNVQGIKKFLAQNNYSYPTLMDFDGNISMTYYISAYPTTFIISPEGKVINGALGAISAEQLRKMINVN